MRAAALALAVTLLASPWLIPAVAPLGQVVAGYEVSDTGREVAADATAGTTADASADTRADTRADADAVIGDVEVPRAGAARPSHASPVPPPCLTEEGAPCGEPILAGVELLDAVDVVFGAVVVDTSLNVHRLQMLRDRAHVRWRSELEPAVRGSAAPGAVRVERSGTTLLVGTANELHALGTKDGHHEWTASLAGRGDGRTPWHGWVVEDTVFAANPRAAVALDADDGQVLWQEDGPFTGVLPLATGVAVLRDGGVAVFGPGQREPRWERDVDPLARFPRGTDRPNHGLIPVAGGGSRILLDPASGALIHDLGHTAEVTRAHGGSVVSVSWDAEGTASALVGFAADGRERWRLEGPDRPCCHVEVRPTDDGRVIVLFPGGADGEAGWLIEPATGTVAARVHRPADVAWVPRLLSDATVVWMDGDAFVATDTAGTPRWRAESESRLLSATPLLLGTRDGLVRPSSAG